MSAAGAVARPSGPHIGHVSLSEVLGALSHALDLTDGQPLGHTMRTCLIGMRLAEELALPSAERSALYYALLIKDAGCSSNAARMAALFGSDDREVKPRLKVADWHSKLAMALPTFRAAGKGQPLSTRLRLLYQISRGATQSTRELISIRCERGASIARQLGFPESTAAAIRSLDEHWCGLGHPEGLAGEEIPLLARIANLAQTVEAFHESHDVSTALRVVRQRRGSWFDPRLADIVLRWRRDDAWWAQLRTLRVQELLLAAEPADVPRQVDDDGLDVIAQAFADIVDAKSPFTYRHSSRVAEYARRLGAELGADDDEQRRLYRAGLLHDIGKLGVSNRILDKAGDLTAAEWRQVQQHPQYTLSILSQISVFGDFAWTAALHHEKLDGSGYPWGLRAPQLDTAARILAVADVYDALTSERPYRAELSHAEAMEIIEQDRDTRLCGRVIAALREGGRPAD